MHTRALVIAAFTLATIATGFGAPLKRDLFGVVLGSQLPETLARFRSLGTECDIQIGNVQDLAFCGFPAGKLSQDPLVLQIWSRDGIVHSVEAWSKTDADEIKFRSGLDSEFGTAGMGTEDQVVDFNGYSFYPLAGDSWIRYNYAEGKTLIVLLDPILEGLESNNSQM